MSNMRKHCDFLRFWAKLPPGNDPGDPPGGWYMNLKIIEKGFRDPYLVAEVH